MNDTPNGGPAFPQPLALGNEGFKTPIEFGEGGMTLRDYFAAKVMHAELVTSGANEESAIALADAAEVAGQTVLERVAWLSYQVADHMLAARDAAKETR